MNQSNPGKPQIMILGTYHMANPGRDYANLQADDVLAPARQTEIEDVVQRLAAFRPTGVAIEAVPERQAEFDEAYAGYRAGHRALARNEREQIGFRLARMLGHERVHCVDFQQPMDIGGLFAWAAANGQGETVARLQHAIESIVHDMQAKMAAMTVREMLLDYNSPAADELHGHYLTMAAIGRVNEHRGADVVADWYARNLKIFANIARLACAPEDRIVAIFGYGHAPLLRQFVRECPDVDLAPVDAYLQG